MQSCTHCLRWALYFTCTSSSCSFLIDYFYLPHPVILYVCQNYERWFAVDKANGDSRCALHLLLPVRSCSICSGEQLIYVIKFTASAPWAPGDQKLHVLRKSSFTFSGRRVHVHLLLFVFQTMRSLCSWVCSSLRCCSRCTVSALISTFSRRSIYSTAL